MNCLHLKILAEYNKILVAVIELLNTLKVIHVHFQSWATKSSIGSRLLLNVKKSTKTVPPITMLPFASWSL